MKQLRLITDQRQWDAFVTSQQGSFLQSWGWGVFQQSLGRTVQRYGVFDDTEQLVTIAQIIHTTLPFKWHYWYCPHGPLGVVDQHTITLLQQAAGDDGAVFIRFEPLQPLAVSKLKSVPARQAHQTLVLDLTIDQAALLKQFHHKTRYNIRLAERKGVTIRQGKGDADVAAFWRLMQLTYSKVGIKLHDKAYYQTLIQSDYAGLETKLYLAEHDGAVIAANLLYYCGDTAVYAHGGSDYTHRSLMAPHLLQWQQIVDAQAAGYRRYDFWGFDPVRWPGVSRFKQGFGGNTIKYPGGYDLIVNPLKYTVYSIGHQLIISN